MTKRIVVDGVDLEMVDTTAQVVQRALDSAQKQVDEWKKKSEMTAEELAEWKKKHGDSAAVIATKDAEIVKLQTQLKDSELSPQKLDAALMDRVAVVDKAKSILGDKVVVKDKTAADIRRQVVDSYVGDIAKGWTDDHVKISFDTIKADSSGKGQGVTDIKNAFAAPRPAQDETAKAYDDYVKDISWESRQAKKQASA